MIRPAHATGATPLFIALASVLLPLSAAHPQEAEPPPSEVATQPGDLAVPQKEVGVTPVRDEEIEERLRGILEATGRFEQLAVRVEDGVVFLEGTTLVPEHKEWARQLALRLEDVAAVVNNIDVSQRPPWDLTPGIAAIKDLWRAFIQGLPMLAFSLLVLLFAWLLALGTAWATRRLFARRIETPLLRNVTAKVAAVFVMLLGIYVVLRAANLTTLAATVLGGTGLLGLVLGIAFRDIAENFLASLLISMQKPFRPGDLVTINGHTGYVERVTTRGTLLMGFDGNYIQIPNAVVYKNVIINITANVNTRLDFLIGIGYDTRVSHAQEVALRALREHPTVLDDPEPMVLVDKLGAATVDLRIYFWMDAGKHSIIKVKSAVMRLVLRAFLEEGISLPDEAREVVFPNGVHLISPEQALPQDMQKRAAPTDTAAEATEGEGNLTTEMHDLRQQIDHSRKPEEGEDLLAP